MTLSNAVAISSISGYTPEEEKSISEYVSNVIMSITNVDSLSDKDKITYLKLLIKFRDKNINTLNINDYVTPERQQLINQLQDDYMHR